MISPNILQKNVRLSPHISARLSSEKEPDDLGLIYIYLLDLFEIKSIFESYNYIEMKTILVHNQHFFSVDINGLMR